MPDLPYGEHAFFACIDPGFSGAIAVMNSAATTAKVYDMPISTEKGDRDRQREIDLAGLRTIFEYLRRLPDLVLGIEWPTTRPDEGAERSERFGRGKGYLEAFAFCHRLAYHKLAPNLWKGRLGLDGKTVDGANERAAVFFERLYPQWSHLIRGPRGGVRDGRLDALLMCHFLRARSLPAPSMMQAVVKFGKGSPEVAALVFAKSKKTKRRLLGLDL